MRRKKNTLRDFERYESSDINGIVVVYVGGHMILFQELDFRGHL